MGWRVVGAQAEALAAVAAGDDVVLVVAPDAPVDLTALRAAGPGRAALLVADPADPATDAAAREMAAEVFARRAPG